MKEYRVDLDVLKGIAIIAVVFYHLGLLGSGYLGVDVFFVINGFLVIPGMTRVENWKGYVENVKKRVMRLLPLTLVVTAVCLLSGYYGMLPDDYENLCESIVATNLFSNNILQAVTTKNYWDVVNDYKPLMHTWYVGVLFEFYLVFPLLCLLFRKVTKDQDAYNKRVIWMIRALLCISVLLYLCPGITDGDRFYYLPCRAFELLAGGLIALRMAKSSDFGNAYAGWYPLAFAMTMVVLLSGLLPLEIANTIYKTWMLLLTVCLTSGMLVWGRNKGMKKSAVLALAGKMSFSIFMWHQVVLAFYRYYVTKELSFGFVIGFLLVVACLSWLSYRWVEQRVKVNRRSVMVSLIALLLITFPSFYIYMHAGVVRDVPELNIRKSNVHRNMFKDYSDKIYKCDKDFEKTTKTKVFIIGNSFARDWANILLESEYGDSITMSYVHTDDKKLMEKIAQRAGTADVVFIHGSKITTPDVLWKNIRPGVKVWGIGTKNFGESNGSIYSKRFQPNYLQLTVPCDKGILWLNEQWKHQWGDQYIDLISYAKAKDGNIRVFTPNGKFISMDCRHLTEEGAKYFASVMDIGVYFRK
jgi:peptidoglycan/LPS O-acetylase OafA/YrhL